MTHFRQHKLAPRGKVIAFPSVPRPAAPAPAPVRARKRRYHWSTHAWLAAAWFVAADRLQLAVNRGEVFGALDTLAFFITFVMPVLRIRALLELVSKQRSARLRRMQRQVEQQADVQELRN